MSPDVSMGELLSCWPSAALTLFARYGVGSRDKLGFRPEQPLREVLSRYLIFEPEKVLETLRQAEAEQRRYRVSAAQFERGLAAGGLLVDCRGRDEYATLRLPGARYLDAELAAEIRRNPDQPLWLYDHRGPLAGAAATHFAAMGCASVAVLDGGLLAWSRDVDPAFPAYGAEARQAPLRLLPDRRQLRWRVGWFSSEPKEGDPAALPFECERIWWSRDYVAVLRPCAQDWHLLTPRLQQWLQAFPAADFWQPQRRDEEAQRRRLEQVLLEEVQPTLQSHKGEVELAGFRDGVAHVRLSGGCQGCSSAAITVSEEIAAALLRAVPELEGVEDASWHQDPAAKPHH